MKAIFKNCFTQQQQQFISILVLTGILSLSTGFTWLQTAAAASNNSAPATYSEMLKGKDKLMRQRQHERHRDRSQRLPRPVANAVRQDLSRRVGIPPGQLRIIKYSRETWPDSCLGLPRPDEFCTQALVEGWRVVVSDGRQTWVYRTDSQGRNLRLENQKASNDLPKSVENAVLRDASRRLRIPISQLRIVQAERRQWPDGCLGLGGPGGVCTAVVVPGWQVTVEARQQRLVYRTDESGGNVRLDQAASQISALPAGSRKHKYLANSIRGYTN